MCKTQINIQQPKGKHYKSYVVSCEIQHSAIVEKCSCSSLSPCISYTFYIFRFYFLLSLQVSQQAAKCIPAMVCPELTEQIRREVAASLHQRKGDFTCYFLTDLVTFTLPAGQCFISKQTNLTYISLDKNNRLIT